MNYRDVLRRGMAMGARHRFSEQARSPHAKPGFNRGTRAGSSLEYKDFREYQSGDDLRHIDWNAFARSDKLIVKRFHEEITPHMDLIVDGSASMNLPETRKAEVAIYLCGFFAALARNSGYSHTCWRTDEDCQPVAGCEGEPTTWEPIRFDGCKSPAEAIGKSRPRWRRQGVRILLSDLLWLAEPHLFLGGLAEEAAAVLVVQVLAHTELNPKQTGMRRLVDVETGAIRQVRVEKGAQTRYRETLNRHQAAWQDAAREVGVALVRFEDEVFLKREVMDDPILAHFLQQ